MTPDYAALLAAGERSSRHLTNDEIWSGVNKEADDRLLRKQMVRELDQSPITPDLLAADGWTHRNSTLWDRGTTTLRFDGESEVAVYSQTTHCEWCREDEWHARTIGELRTLVRIEELRQHALRLARGGK